jgi:DNA-binding transcriptional LysR family regulator
LLHPHLAGTFCSCRLDRGLAFHNGSRVSDVKNLDPILAFVRVVEKKSFSAAAKDLKVSASVVSKLVGMLEKELGVDLLRRSTRRLALTGIGAEFYSHCASALSVIDSAKDIASRHSASSEGVIKIQATMGVGLRILGPAIREFMTKFPGMSFEVSLSDVPSQVIDSDYDIVMIHRPSAREKSVACRTFRRVRYLICASPAYLKVAGTPKRPTELAHFNCLIHAKQIRPHEPNGDIVVKVKGNLQINDGLALHDAIVRGLGVGRLPDYHVADGVKLGRIKVLFDNVVYDARTITAAYPRTKYTHPRITLFLDFLDEFISRNDQR